MTTTRKKDTPRWGWRVWLKAGMWFSVALAALLAARAVQAYVLDDPRFIMVGSPSEAYESADFIVQGVSYASRDKIIQVFADDFGKNIFLMPISERRRHLLAIDWVEEAGVSRLWPNRIVVRITERTPVAFVRLSADPVKSKSARPAMIDREGVIMQQPDRGNFSFPVLGGVHERQTEPERREKVARMLRLLREFGPLTKSLTVTEVDLASRDVRLSAEVGDKEVELLLGERSHTRRLETFLAHYPEIHKRTPEFDWFDLRLDNRIIARKSKPSE
ncbi:MAG: cell division protein FtsQ/DivIB [Bryobacteraceae bacterium]